MKTAGIITEYNPFHNGHKYHIEETRRITGADYVIAVMSGDFCQRGIPAVTDKYLRAKMALLNGADLVLELPVRFSTASAEFFAYGSVAILTKLGVVDALCFGSECSDISLLSEIAEVLSEEPDDYKVILKEALKNGLSFPAARELAFVSLPDFSRHKEMLSDVFSSPNNILGIEYLKALKRQKSSITPCTLLRRGAGYHDLDAQEGFFSASGIRSLLESHTVTSAEDFHIPDSVFTLMKESYGISLPVFPDDFSTLLHYRLLLESADGFASYQDSSDALSDKIRKNLPLFRSFSVFADLLKSKEVTHARLYRLLLHILLNLKEDDLHLYMEKDAIDYVRILGFRKSAAPLLSEIKKRSALTLLGKLSDAAAKLNPLSLRLMNETILASHIYQSVLMDKFHTEFKSEYSRPFLRI